MKDSYIDILYMEKYPKVMHTSASLVLVVIIKEVMYLVSSQFLYNHLVMGDLYTIYVHGFGKIHTSIAKSPFVFCSMKYETTVYINLSSLLKSIGDHRDTSNFWAELIFSCCAWLAEIKCQVLWNSRTSSSWGFSQVFLKLGDLICSN